MQVNWPALLKIEGDEHLIYCRDELTLRVETASLILPISKNDFIVDSQGQQFYFKNDGKLWLSDTKYSLTELTQLIRAHLSALNHCCVTKLRFNNFQQAIAAGAT
ncbi:DUF4144 family protein [Psychrobium sp. nBUS_13]|uniref:DUF4144 family protein n=1 Tax=Psychrobium sp. nBUS_13 TaxID=3395319 RepID=UPI003EBB6277